MRQRKFIRVMKAPGTNSWLYWFGNRRANSRQVTERVWPNKPLRRACGRRNPLRPGIRQSPLWGGRFFGGGI